MYTASNMSHAQREYVGGVIETLIQRETDYYARLNKKADKNPTNYRGRREPIETGANPSLGFVNPAAGDTPTPGAPTLNHYLIPYVFLAMGLAKDYESILNNAKGAVNDPLRQATEGTARQMAKWLNIYASQGDGTTGLATASAAYDGTNATTKKTFVTNGASDSIGSTNVIPGQKGFIYDATGTTQRVGTVGSGVLTVSTASTSKTSLLFTTDLPSDYISGDRFFPEGTTPSVGLHGVPSLNTNSGTIFGVSRTAVPTTQSTVVNGSAGLSAGLLMQTYLQIRQRTGSSGVRGEGALEMWYGITQQQAYYALTTAQSQLLFPRDGDRRPNIDIGGSNPDEFSWFGVKMNLGLDWLGNRIDFLNMSKMCIAMLKEPGKMLAPFDGPLPAFNGTTSNYKMATQEFWDAALEFYTPAGHRHGVLGSLPIAGFAQQKS